MKIGKTLIATLHTSTLLLLLTSCYEKPDDGDMAVKFLNKKPSIEVEVVAESEDKLSKESSDTKKEFDPADYSDMSSIGVTKGLGEIYLQAQARRSLKDGLSKADRLELLEFFMYRHALELPKTSGLEQDTEKLKKVVAVRNKLVEKKVPSRVFISVAPGDMFKRLIEEDRLIFSSDRHELLPYNKKIDGFEYKPPSQSSCYNPTDSSPVYIPVITQPGVINMDGLLGLEIEPYSLFRGAQDCFFKPVNGADTKAIDAAIKEGSTAILGRVYFDIDGVAYDTIGLKPVYRELTLHLIKNNGSLSEPVAIDEFTYKPANIKDESAVGAEAAPK